MYVKTRNLTGDAPAGLRRREPRYVSSIAVGVTRYLRFGPAVARGMSLDVSRSGMSALVCGAPRVGETVVIAPRMKVESVEIDPDHKIWLDRNFFNNSYTAEENPAPARKVIHYFEFAGQFFAQLLAWWLV